jgi:hypothetical protein
MKPSNRMPSGRVLFAAWLGVALSLDASAARADLPPPDGTRFVSYAYAVDGLEAHPDYVLLGYPSSGSNGRPMDDYAELGKQPVTLGRRGGSPTIYAAKRSDYESWKATLAPLGPDAPLFDNPSFKAFFASDKVVRCDEAPKPRFTLPSSDPREGIVERFRVAALGPGRCDLERVSDGSGAAAPSEPAGFATPPDDAAQPGDALLGGAGAPPSRGGCAGCTVASTEHGERGLAAAMLGLGVVIAARLRRPTRGSGS